VLALGGRPASARAQYAQRDNPYAYDLRLAIFPAAFQTGVSQTYFGSALRAEVDLSRRFTLSAAVRVPWLVLVGDADAQGFALRAALAWNFVDRVDSEKLAGTVYPEDTPAISEHPGSSFEVPTNQRLGSPRFRPPDADHDGSAAVRSVHALRLGYDLVRSVQREHPDVPLSADPLAASPDELFYQNTVHAFHLGYAWAKHWNLSPASVGQREVGWRRFYLDAIVTFDPLARSELIGTDPGWAQKDRKFFPAGLRIGMEGAIDALLRRAPGVGFAYSVELGVLPATRGIDFEPYLFVGLGLEFDLVLQPHRLPR
jgi:hypothetical protein